MFSTNATSKHREGSVGRRTPKSSRPNSRAQSPVVVVRHPDHGSSVVPRSNSRDRKIESTYNESGKKKTTNLSRMSPRVSPRQVVAGKDNPFHMSSRNRSEQRTLRVSLEDEDEVKATGKDVINGKYDMFDDAAALMMEMAKAKVQNYKLPPRPERGIASEDGTQGSTTRRRMRKSSRDDLNPEFRELLRHVDSLASSFREPPEARCHPT